MTFQARLQIAVCKMNFRIPVLLGIFTYVLFYPSRVDGLLSFSRETLDTDFYLFTPRSTKANGERIAADYPNSIRSTTFDPNLKLTVIVHGFTQDGFKPWITKMRKELMKKENRNIIVVNWETGIQYFEAAYNTHIVGSQLAVLINELHSQFRFNSTNVHVIGHSLGAHVAGFAGAFLRMRNLMKIGRITGLDPARLGFNNRSPDLRLDPSDAEFVDVIHTDTGYNYLKGGLGLERISGHMDFYPNGGAFQPGCENFDNLLGVYKKLEKFARGSSLASMFACDHMKVIDYFTSSINHQCSRKAFPCESWEVFKQGRCFKCQGACPEMGYKADQYHVNGSRKFYLSTYDNGGYCAPRHYVSVVISGLRLMEHGFWHLGTVIKVFEPSDKIEITLTGQDGKTIRAVPSAIEDGSQISRLVLSDDRPGTFVSIVLSYTGNQPLYVGKAIVRDENNTYTACFNTQVSSGIWKAKHQARLRTGEHDC